MALSKTITVDFQNQNNALAPTATSFTAEPVVTDNKLVVGHNLRNPGVFTAGTAVERSNANPNIDSNA